MTTIQPRLVRADTLDLQPHNAPSAQDHTRSPTFAPYSHGAAGPHHREALRNAEETAYNDRKSSPRVSMEDAGPHSVNQVTQYDSTDEDGDDEQHDGIGADSQNEGDYEDGNEENDEDLDEDLMDKISSSPSIEDGKYSLSFRPLRVDSIGSGAYPAPSTPSRGDFHLCSHCLSLSSQTASFQKACQVGRHLSKRSSDTIYDGHTATDTFLEQPVSEGSLDTSKSDESNAAVSVMESKDVYAHDVRHLFFPADDPVLDDVFVDDEDTDNEQAWVDEGEPLYPEESSSDDDLDDFHFSDNPRFIDSGWGGECLREIEDIDFEFVYALHTFVATVEGQANATKGDTMVLLDDSNSYWWLVRVVKDGSIGYLPAEHIETPTERLARLNKHRNIDLSASMLGDNPEKSKNPLKKAMRRRNAKTVAFTAPTYYEPSEYDYDSEDEEEEGVEGLSNAQIQAMQESENGEIQEGQGTDLGDSIIIVNGIKQVDSDDQAFMEAPGSPVKMEGSESLSAQSPLDESFQRSRNGVVRNTDSFFKDDTVETKKISLTPRLLRNDADSTANSDSDLRSKTSSETFDKLLGPDDKSREKEKKKKGMLSGLFKRKDKSAKSSKSDIEEERAEDGSRTAQPKDSVESMSGPQSPDRKPGKLQKNPPPAGLAIRTSPTDNRQQSNQISSNKSPLHSPIVSETPASAPGPEPQITVSEPVQTDQTPNRFPSLNEKRNMFAPITNVLKSSPSHEGSSKPVYSKRAKERFAIDGSDSDDDHTPTMSQISQDHRDVSPMRNSQLSEARSDSAMEVSPVEQSDTDLEDEIVHSRGPLSDSRVNEQYTSTHDTHGIPQSDTASTSKPSPSLATHTPSTSRSTPTWSDASLRSYMESDQDIRDLLIIVHDKTNVTPVGPDHPLMGGLFTNERTRLAEMQTQLDSMLTTWISKKNPGLLSR